MATRKSLTRHLLLFCEDISLLRLTHILQNNAGIMYISDYYDNNSSFILKFDTPYNTFKFLEKYNKSYLKGLTLKSKTRILFDFDEKFKL
jgi:hypothetical protein